LDLQGLAANGIDSLSLHDALPILKRRKSRKSIFAIPAGMEIRLLTSGIIRQNRTVQYPYRLNQSDALCRSSLVTRRTCTGRRTGDRKSTRLNSSHVKISYAVFCLK